MSKYWINRQKNLRATTTEEIEKQLIKIYSNSFDNIKRYMKDTIEAIESDGVVIISDLYKYDRYYKMIIQLKNELKRLGKKEEAVLDEYLTQYAEKVQLMVDEELQLPTILDKESINYIVDNIWAGDGKNYSDRIWEDKSKLIPVLTQKLVDVVALGGSIHEATKKVEEYINDTKQSSYYVAKRLIRTEISYIQNQTALDRYRKAGIKQYKYYTANDDKVCEKCKLSNGKVYEIESAEIGVNLPPKHPNCRCFISPVVI